MTSLLLCGDSREVLRSLPSDFFHCAVTSPPYLGLRRYDGGELVWDGDDHCEHEWGCGIPRAGYRSSDSHLGKLQSIATQNRNVGSSNTCSLCSAWRGQLGAEPTPDLYIQHLLQVCREVRRVLRPDGVFWLNIGDSWVGSWGAMSHNLDGKAKRQGTNERPPQSYRVDGAKPLDMTLVPFQLALALRSDGWYVRSVPVWVKPNSMPESVNGWRWERHRVKVGDNGRGREAWRQGANPTPQQDHDKSGNFLNSATWEDCPGCPKCSPNNGFVLRKGAWRPTDSYEFILILTKTDSYYCDREAVREPYIEPMNRWGGETLRANGQSEWDRGTDQEPYRERNMRPNSDGRNLRSVWSFPTQPYKGAHFATYPQRLPETCIKAATSAKGCCPKCGSPWARVIESSNRSRTQLTGEGQDSDEGRKGRAGEVSSRTADWRPTCSCGVLDPVPCRVLDPFSGAGTTSLAAERLGRDSVGIDCSEQYTMLARERLDTDARKRSSSKETVGKEAANG